MIDASADRAMAERRRAGPMKIACLVRPHLGGTYSVFRQLRNGLEPAGVDLRWVTSGRNDGRSDPRWRRDQAFGDSIDPDGALSDEARAAALAAFIASAGFDGVIVNVLADGVEMDVARYLPKGVLRVMVVHNITPGTYAAARALRDHVHATVCVAPRSRDDLIARFGFDRDRTHVISNAVDVQEMSHAASARSPHTALRILFLGRIEDASKGVFWLPKIMGGLNASVTLTVAGSGPDERRLRAALRRYGSRVRLLGPVASDAVPNLLARHDVLLMPSRFEGAPMSLIEAMAAGCVPVASRIRNVTDVIVEHGKEGMTFPVGDWRTAARHISGLDQDRARLAALSAAAADRAKHAFGLERMTTLYAALLDELRVDPPEIAAPLRIEDWRPHGAARAVLRSRTPQIIKNWLRLAHERLQYNLRTPSNETANFKDWPAS